MKSLEEILENITRVVSTYESGQYKDLNEMQRILSTNMFFLAQKQVENSFHRHPYKYSEKFCSLIKERRLVIRYYSLK